MTRLEVKDWKWKEYSDSWHLIYEWWFKDGKYNWFWRKYSNYSLQYEWSFVDWEPKWYWKIYNHWAIFYVGEMDRLPNGKWIIFYDNGIRTEWIFKNWKPVDVKTYDFDWTFLYDWEYKIDFSWDRDYWRVWNGWFI